MSNSIDRGALTIIRIGPGYSAVQIPGGIPAPAGVTAGRMYNNLRELQDHLLAMGVKESAIPTIDFEAPLIIDL